jgi:hypothetical protein
LGWGALYQPYNLFKTRKAKIMTYESYVSGLTEYHLDFAFTRIPNAVEELCMWSISVLPSGHGHFSIRAEWIIDGKKEVVIKTTNNMELIDAWKEGSLDFVVGYYNSWDEVVDTILELVGPFESLLDTYPYDLGPSPCR